MMHVKSKIESIWQWLLKGYTARRNLIAVIAIFIGVCFVLIPISPLLMKFSGRDSGVFLFSGWRMLQGEIPYVDFWDHKPPVIFLINAGGLIIGGGTLWGVWAIEFVFLFLGTSLGFWITRKIFNDFAAFCCLILSLLTTFFLIQGGNYTTEYTMLFQILILCLYLRSIGKDSFLKYGFLIGVLTGLSFLTKQNTIGLGSAVSLFLVWEGITQKTFKKVSVQLLSIFLGAALVFAVTIIVLTAVGGLSAFIDAAFIYNIAYAASDNPESYLAAILAGHLHLSRTFLIYFTLAGFVLAVFRKQLGLKISIEMEKLLFLCLILFPIEIVFVSIPGRNYQHYFLTLIPVCLILSAYSIWAFAQLSGKYFQSSVPAVILIMAVMLVAGRVNIGNYLWMVKQYSVTNSSEILDYLNEKLDKDDPFLMFGAETVYNFYTGRPSASRYNYQYPLFNPNFSSEEIILEFFEDLDETQPKIIVDTKNTYTPWFAFPVETDLIQTEVDEFLSLYKKSVVLNNWDVYERIPQK